MNQLTMKPHPSVKYWEGHLMSTEFPQKNERNKLQKFN